MIITQAWADEIDCSRLHKAINTALKDKVHQLKAKKCIADYLESVCDIHLEAFQRVLLILEQQCPHAGLSSAVDSYRKAYEDARSKKIEERDDYTVLIQAIEAISEKRK